MDEELVIENGRLIDPQNNVDEVTSVGVTTGRVAWIGNPPKPSVQDGNSRFRRVFNASGCLVVPGLIDLHVHVYQHATPLGTNPDERCLARGVTTVVDAGSAGSCTFPGLRKLIAERCQTRLLAFLHIATHGLAAAGCCGLGVGGEIDSLNAVDTRQCVDCINQNRDMIVGIKLRLAKSISVDGKNEQEAYRRALEASKTCKVPLMVHHSISTVGLEKKEGYLGCPDSLCQGDIYTHCLNGHEPGILDPDSGKVAKVCWEAKKRGVVFDVGHGQGSFSWRVAEQAASENFWPDAISTDLHVESQDGPAYDLPCVMTKMLALGMPLQQVIKAVTQNPAQVIGKLDEMGHLGVGMPATVTILKLVDLKDTPLALEDSHGRTKSIQKVFVPMAVFIQGREFPVDSRRYWPNEECQASCFARWGHK